MAEAPEPQNRVAWVTGAGSGIGRGLARRLAESGWIVAASARTARDLDSLAAEVPGRITAFQLDVTRPEACAATVAAIETALGPIDLAILNAGGGFPVSVDNFSVPNFRRTVELNLMGTVQCLGPLLPTMIARRAGHVAIMGSLAGYVGVPGSSAYGATKAALNSLAESFKTDFDRLGLTLTIINPGFVETPLTARNSFAMPFLMPLEPALDRIIAGLERRRFEIAFPWPAVFFVRILRLLPHWLRFRLVRGRG